jgi:hypothetical protein
MLLEAPSLMPLLLLLPKLASCLADVHIKPKSQYRTLNFVSMSTSLISEARTHSSSQ